MSFKKTIGRATLILVICLILEGLRPGSIARAALAENIAGPEITESQQHGIDNHDSGHDSESFEATEFIIDHIKDSHEWHLWTNRHGHHVSVALPVILYSKHSGFHVFMSSRISHGDNYRGFEMGRGEYEGKIIEVSEDGELVGEGLPLDFSFTKNVFMMFVTVILLLVIFLSLARRYKKAGIREPRGIEGFIEPLIVFVEEDIAIPNIGEEKYHRFMPYLLTVFFFILSLNLLGLVPFFPFGANVTGNIAVTMVLALFTFFITQFSGNRNYWQHVFNTPGVAWWLKFPIPLMPIVELVGLISKPFALMVRLFANITAGHIVVLSLVSIIFIFKSVAMAPVSLVFVLFMYLLELLVAFLQAYIFTLLSALFIGLAMPQHHHD